MGLVPKPGNKTQLIFHLSYCFPNGNESVNYWTPHEWCTVKYNDLDTAVRYSLRIIQQYIKRYGGPPPESLAYSKMDMTSTFRILPCSPGSWLWMVLKAQYPITGRTYYFYWQEFSIWCQYILFLIFRGSVTHCDIWWCSPLGGTGVV